MVSMNATVTLAALFPLTVITVISRLASSRIERYRRATRKIASAVTGFITETFGAVQAVKVACAEDRVVNHLAGLCEERRQAGLSEHLFGAILQLTFANSVNLGIGLTLLLAAHFLRARAITVGDLILFVYLLDYVMQFVGNTGMLLTRYRQAEISIGRLESLLGDTPEVLIEAGPIYLDGTLPEVPYASKSAGDRLEELSAVGLCFRYPDSEHGIENVNLKLRRGSFTVVTGRIGSGKTTLLRTLLGLLRKQAGDILWNGKPVQDPASFFVPPRSAYAAQVPRMFSDTLRENLLLGMPEELVDLSGAIRSAVLERDLEELEDGLDTTVGTRGVKLSGGQAQRAAAARVFVRDAELLVFDDLSSALDVETEQTLWERLFSGSERPEPPTCLVVSHRRPILRHADHVIVLQDGAVAAEGSLNHLLETSEEMQRLWASDMGKTDDTEKDSRK
jgi:ATP-binding cassette subfamily B protein